MKLILMSPVQGRESCTFHEYSRMWPSHLTDVFIRHVRRKHPGQRTEMKAPRTALTFWSIARRRWAALFVVSDTR